MFPHYPLLPFSLTAFTLLPSPTHFTCARPGIEVYVFNAANGTLDYCTSGMNDLHIEGREEGRDEGTAVSEGSRIAVDSSPVTTVIVVDSPSGTHGECSNIIRK
ncbi:hypothetical protein BDR22DRAFT_854628 [Usnea florida]